MESFYSSFLLSLMPMLFRIMHYAGKLKPYSVVSKDAGLILWEIETLFSCLKGRGFNLENTRLTDPRRVKKLIAVLAISFCWCYLTGEWQHDQKKAIKIKKHGRLSMSLFRYGLDYVQMAIQRLIGFGKKEEFKEILAILRRQNPDRIRVL
ncbi:hypothetical protein T633_0557 [Acinetobacter baumannii MRSN 58]|nr:hypothetical protein T633_0557 [Acinetobacter baumannii MRSN 58]